MAMRTAIESKYFRIYFSISKVKIDGSGNYLSIEKDIVNEVNEEIL